MRYLPNILSISRIGLSITAFLAILCYQQWLLAFIILALALTSDWLDGWLARKFHWESKCGKYLDKIGDTVFFPLILIGIAVTHKGIFWPIIIILISAFIGKLLRACKKVPKEIRFLLNIAITSLYVILSVAAVMLYMYEAFGLDNKPIWLELIVWGTVALICFGALRYNYRRVLIWVTESQKIIEDNSPNS